ncbi:glycoside hydrolase family 127 protein [Flavobacterium sp. Sd200]|uniref:glycoside hydrolase family 127 protein n=1 Tax=Flavobacterium sp. Sd200 TaxID=2692211 RepID=UPI00136E2845|nr:glycoside hydrolase family 127 protein [Flavobacterium sp. Sd200]MXN91522.1 glycoside hydrolase family 127 protein [Flavobacterium sp. Sd200]
MKKLKKTGLLLFSLVATAGFAQSKDVKVPEKAIGYPIQAVPIADVKVTDNFWLPIIKRVQEKTIEYAIQKCTEEGRFDNFLVAGGVKKGETRGQMPFDDSDVYKIIEGASNSLISSPDPKLEVLLDSLIGIIKIGQEKDGYLTTWRTINPAKPPAKWVKVEKGVRWEYMNMSHEEYNAGHMYEAAAVHFKATGKRNFLDIALKNADLFVKTFGEGNDKILAVPGHQIIETGLIKLYEITGKEDYLKLAKFFLDHRGDPAKKENYGEYSQDHKHVTDQDEVVGHAVRAVYMYAGMTDIAAIYKDKSYREAVDKLWDNMVEKKIYVTGGIGAKHEGEAFGANYELPNLSAYNETCAAIGSVYWNNRLFNLTGNVKYNDLLERTMYNAVISGMSLKGTEFFYPNPMESDGVYKFNMGACTRSAWFDCSCCPTNLIRFIPAIPGLIYAQENQTLFVNLYMSNTANVNLNGTAMKVAQETNYPWDGKVKLTVSPQKAGTFTVKMRVPGWARNEVMPGGLYNYVTKSSAVPTLSINGKMQDAKIADGYFILNRKWKKGDVVEVNFPMEIREVVASEKIAEDQNKVSLEYGPLVYTVEEADNANVDAIAVSSKTSLTTKAQPNLLNGIYTIEGTTGTAKFTAIPYYTWSNRGIGKMKVWIPKK